MKGRNYMERITGTDWEVNGFVRDTSGKIIPNVKASLMDEYGVSLGESILDDSGYSAFGEYDPDKIFFYFTAPGYMSLKVPVSILLDSPTVTLHKENSIEPWMILLVIAAVIAYRKKTKKIGAFDMSNIFPILLLVGGVIGFSVVKIILEKLGLWKSQETKDLDNASSDPNSFWSPNYWQLKPASQQWTYLIDETTARQWAKEIYDSFGAFNDCEECVIAVFKRCRTKANCSFLAWEWQKVYGEDLLTYIRGGNWPSDRLSDADVSTINKYISGLPNY